MAVHRIIPATRYDDRVGDHAMTKSILGQVVSDRAYQPIRQLSGKDLDAVSGGASIVESSVHGVAYWTVDGWIKTFNRPSGDGLV
jgi:hypothetical protein